MTYRNNREKIYKEKCQKGTTNMTAKKTILTYAGIKALESERENRKVVKRIALIISNLHFQQ